MPVRRLPKASRTTATSDLIAFGDPVVLVVCDAF
jgi:hypothetical protein